MKLSLKSNIRVGVALYIIILLTSTIASYTSIQNFRRTADLVVTSNGVINDLDNIFSTLKDAETSQRGYLLTKNNTFLEPYYGSAEKIEALYDKIKKDTNRNGYQQRKLAELKAILENRLDALAAAISEKNNNNATTEKLLLEGKTYMDRAAQIIIDIKDNERKGLTKTTSDMDEFSIAALWLIMFAAFLSFLSTLYFYRKVLREVNQRVTLYQELHEVNDQTEHRIDTIKSIAKQISNGNYKVRLQEASKDGLGSVSRSLNNMAESLQKAFNQLEDKDWMQSGIAALNGKLVGEKDLSSLSRDILTIIVEHTKSAVGAFYILNDQNKLKLINGYALDSNSQKAEIEPGEGLVGQAFLSKKLISIDKIPNNEATISFASGKTKPSRVVAFPIMKNNQAIGVIELATINQYPQRKLDFMTGIAINVGIALIAAQNRQKLQDVLEETQSQSEELQAQHVELAALNTNLEMLNTELESQTLKIQASEEELRVQQEELLQSNQELEERTSLLEERNQLILERNTEIRQKAELLEQSTKYKSEFLANMSHELRTPLNSILLLSKLMADSEEISSEYTEYASVIQSSGQGLLSLIDEILDLSKIEAGKMTLEVGPITVEELTIDMRSLFNPLAKDKHLDLFIGVAGNTPDIFFSDKLRLSQILKNLLANAFKFTSKGHVKFYIGYNEHEKQLTFTVSDTGIGIPLEKQALIFDAFQQADGSTKRKFGGTGLGLSISKELAKLLGGSITLTSDKDSGSTFTLTIPTSISGSENTVETANKTQNNTATIYEANLLQDNLIADTIPDEIDDDRANISPNDRVILIIEDDTNFAKTLVKFTRKQNYKAIVAVRGDLGVEMAHQYNPRAILLDLQLPVKDGWQVMDELKANAKTKHIPIHVMSSVNKKRESLLKGAIDFISKPFALEHLQEIFKNFEFRLSKGPKKVLIIEENKAHAEALTYFLNSANIQTLSTPNIEDGADYLDQKEVDAIILDMGIPNKTAYDTLEKIKNNDSLRNLPIIIFTGSNLSKGEEAKINQYTNSIVVKTVNSYKRILDEAGLFLHLVEEKDDPSTLNGGKKSLVHNLSDVLKDKTILIADDDIRNIFSITKALEQHGVKVIPAIDGKEALAALKANNKIDAVLMDIMMPEMDGYETMKLIRNIHAFKNLPILAVTAKAMVGDREKCIAAGASDYISKPVDLDQLLSLLRVWLYSLS